MGSFDGTCCISGFPIGAGDPIRYLLLTENPFFDGGFVCEPHGRWFPRTWPIRAEYNDYGSIQNWEEGAIKDSFMAGFQEDLVEVGIGDNSIHDVSAKKDMTFDQMLEAVWEGRVRVLRRLQNESNSDVPDHVPTLANVETVISDIKLEEGRYLVDEPEGSGWVRVRWDGLRGGYGRDTEFLTLAKGYLQRKFAVVLTAGSGSGSHTCELRCFILPGYRRGVQSHDKGTLLIQQAMIREDVWQALTKLKTCAYRRPSLSWEIVPETIGLYYHANCILRSGSAPEDLEDQMGEFLFIQHILSIIRYVWKPSDTSGPQHGEWKQHILFLREMLDIALSQNPFQ